MSCHDSACPTSDSLILFSSIIVLLYYYKWSFVQSTTNLFYLFDRAYFNLLVWFDTLNLSIRYKLRILRIEMKLFHKYQSSAIFLWKKKRNFHGIWNSKSKNSVRIDISRVLRCKQIFHATKNLNNKFEKKLALILFKEDPRIIVIHSSL